MFSYIIVFFFIVVFIQISQLRDRIRILEQKAGIKKFVGPLLHPKEKVTEKGDGARGGITIEENTPVAIGQMPVINPNQFSEWIKEDWMLKVGALFLIIGFGWFTTYAFMNDWIGPIGRITLGILTGTVLMVFGWLRARSYVNQGGIFLVLGSTIVLLTIFAAREVYDFFTPLSALSIMFLSTVFVALVSVKYRNVYLGLSSIILAGVAPLLVGGSNDNVMMLFGYLLVVVLGTLWVVSVLGRRELLVASFMLVSFYSAPYIIDPSSDTTLLLPFAYMFTVIFFIANITAFLKNKEQKNNALSDLVSAGYTGLFLLAWIFSGVPDEWKSLIVAAWLIVFAVAAFIVLSLTKRRDVFLVYGAVALTYLASATAIELQGHVLTIAYTLESVFVVFLIHHFTRNITLTERSALLLIGPAILSLESLTGSIWYSSFFHEKSFTLFLITTALMGTGLALRSYAKISEDGLTRKINAGLIITGSLYGLALLWKSLHATLLEDHAVAVFLIIATIIAIVTYVQGVERAHTILRRYGMWVLIAVIARLFIVDVWEMEMVGRIVTFFIIGTLLAGTAFIGRRMRIEKKDATVIS